MQSPVYSLPWGGPGARSPLPPRACPADDHASPRSGSGLQPDSLQCSYSAATNQRRLSILNQRKCRYGSIHYCSLFLMCLVLFFYIYFAPLPYSDWYYCIQQTNNLTNQLFYIQTLITGLPYIRCQNCCANSPKFWHKSSACLRRLIISWFINIYFKHRIWTPTHATLVHNLCKPLKCECLARHLCNWYLVLHYRQ